MRFIPSFKSKAEQYPIGILLCFFPTDRFNQPHLFDYGSNPNTVLPMA